MYRDIPDDLRALIEPVVEDHGCELVDVDVPAGRGPGTLKVIIDTASRNVSVDVCVEVSRELGTHLDATNVFPGSYRLEVSSPGLDRVLAREKDFVEAEGAEVRIRTRRPLDGRKRFRGQLVKFEGGIVRVAVDREETDIPFEEIEKANTIYQFSRADFSGRGSN